MQNLYESSGIAIPAGENVIFGDLTVPDIVSAAVILAHSGSFSRQSPVNQRVGETLNHGGIATLVVDLLTAEEKLFDNLTGELRFNIDFLADRLMHATDWLRRQPDLLHLSYGYFATGTCAAASLVAASIRAKWIHAIVSAEGRPDLAGKELAKVQAPTLLLVGQQDRELITRNRRAVIEMRAPAQLRIVAKTSHPLQDPITLDKVASMTREWFESKLIHRLAA